VRDAGGSYPLNLSELFSARNALAIHWNSFGSFKGLSWQRLVLFRSAARQLRENGRQLFGKVEYD